MFTSDQWKCYHSVLARIIVIVSVLATVIEVVVSTEQSHNKVFSVTLDCRCLYGNQPGTGMYIFPTGCS